MPPYENAHQNIRSLYPSCGYIGWGDVRLYLIHLGGYLFGDLEVMGIDVGGREVGKRQLLGQDVGSWRMQGH